MKAFGPLYRPSHFVTSRCRWHASREEQILIDRSPLRRRSPHLEAFFAMRRFKRSMSMKT